MDPAVSQDCARVMRFLGDHTQSWPDGLGRQVCASPRVKRAEAAWNAACFKDDRAAWQVAGWHYALAVLFEPSYLALALPPLQEMSHGR